MPDYRVIIPARFASSRLPGKPLLDIAGKSMVERVYLQACKSSAKEIIIATDDARIEQAAQSFGAKAVMTSADHQSGTDRLQEVVSQLGLAADDIVVNVQGDEPLIPPQVIEQVAQNLAASSAGIATLCEPVIDMETAFDPNAVKVVADAQGYALYFSRAPVPYSRDTFNSSHGQNYGSLPPQMNLHRHIGIYAYRVSLLHDFVRWGPCDLEQTECLEQLRAMWHGVKIHVEQAQITPPAGVDTEADLNRVRAFFQS
ncbi:3-deoxy-manno-octulosonate cytidylyltransferase [Ketobacter sp. MCCC 1A13808]|uniref:3-deoxy-manno-octulosonate cytidylyltransferase n=1 Tax=Ketobacter sp. MCCC 1A13808 TaxID=2602738 RepID=UPI000F2D858B|nr:3-deoxy-manno-octulosonate cytidylyltransferase [Ketobacter sp. MCCC 1A13808]MVF10699.1 3-deoxy-manno-octulosonate cytidylyltransferase [Ketobacter sp. MCCC 1A13808]RLP56118.1 MAG: 3-deoxy-manno-octulosonate cytidylyltransferase [Ketobacter sp.]